MPSPTRIAIQALSLGTIGCGIVIIYSALSFQAQSTRPYRENLHALANTIKELNRTIVEVRNQSQEFDKYLIDLQKGLGTTGKDLASIEAVANEFIQLAGDSTTNMLREAAKALTEAKTTVRATADQAGQVPLDPLAAQRKSLYDIAGSCAAVAGTMNATATEVKKKANEFRGITSSSLSTARSALVSSQKQIGILRRDSVERLPIVLGALSQQLTAHLQLIDASYDLLNRVSVAIIAVGSGFVCIGLTSLLRLSLLSERSNERPRDIASSQ